METFKDFMKLPATQGIIGKSIYDLQNDITTILLPFTQGKDSAKSAAEEAVKLVKDESLITEISNEVGTPKENETEDEFVTRCLKIADKLLSKKLGM
jgi:hypothetical protein